MKTKTKTRLTMLTVVLILSLLLGTSAMAQGTPVLFGDAGEYNLAAVQANQPHVARARYVSVNVDMLFGADGKPLGKGALPEVTLNLFADATYTGRVTRAWHDRWGSYWTGNLNGVPGGYFQLTVVDGAFMAHVGSTRGIYEVAYTPEGRYRAYQVDQSKFTDHNDAWTYEPSSAVVPEGSLGTEADSGDRIDIMVAFTDDARAAAGGTPAIKATILTALNETNTSYANAGVTTRLRLVHVEEYSYTETGNMDTDLSRFRGSGDAYFTTIHTLRNIYGADMVGLITENGGGYCGLASTIMADAATAFQVTDRDCATGYYSFGHEFGHLQGARHDTFVDPNNTPYAYGHGYVKTTSPSWRTIMAYANACGGCTRIQRWSNPAKTYGGAPTGVSNTKNYLVINNTDYTVANFRAEIIGNDFNSTFNGSSSGWSAVIGSWALNSGLYYRTGGVVNKLSSAKHTGVYGDLTFEARMKRTGCTWCSNGLIIRGNPNSQNSWGFWYSSYWFAYSQDGRFGIYEYSSTGGETELKGWTSNPAIVTGNNWNTLKVVAVGSTMKFYINGTLVWTITDSTLKTGRVGVAMYRNDTSSGNALLVDWAKLTNTPTADPNPNEEVAPGVEVPGGNGRGAPH